MENKSNRETLTPEMVYEKAHQNKLMFSTTFNYACMIIGAILSVIVIFIAILYPDKYYYLIVILVFAIFAVWVAFKNQLQQLK